MIEVKRNKRTKAIKRIRSKFGRNVNLEILIFKSNKYLYAQLIDLQSGKTLLTSSSLGLKNEIKKNNISTSCKDAAKLVGINLAKQCLDKKISLLPSLNRASYPFHGIVGIIYETFYKEFKVDKN